MDPIGIVSKYWYCFQILGDAYVCDDILTAGSYNHQTRSTLQLCWRTSCNDMI